MPLTSTVNSTDLTPLVSVQLPIGSEADLTGLVDLVEMKVRGSVDGDRTRRLLVHEINCCAGDLLRWRSRSGCAC